jgi:hypothetical protein
MAKPKPTTGSKKPAPPKPEVRVTHVPADKFFDRRP